MGCIQINSLKNKKNKISTNQPLKEFNKEEFIEEALKQHNKLRNNHHAGNLIIEEELQNYAQNFAEELANKNEEYHSQCELDGKIIGENIFVCDNNNNITGVKMTNDFYNEIKNYDFNKGECVINASRFTQLVWKNSKKVGFGIATSKSGKIYVVVNYYPAGNNLGEYKENVQNKN